MSASGALTIFGTPGRGATAALAAFAACSIGAPLRAASAQAGESYPTKPVRVVTAAAAGSNDFAARAIAQELAVRLGQSVIVDNRPGRFVAGDIVAKALPDGHTLLLSGTTLWVGPLLHGRPSYDAVVDFAPITLATRSPNVLVVHPSLGASNVRELIALAKSRPGAMNYSTGSLGASAHLAGELFKFMAAIDVACIPYKGAGPSLNALMGAEVHYSFPAAGSGMPHVRAGRLRVLAVTSEKPTELAPGVPTVASSGLPQFESSSIIGLFAPAKTNRRIVERLNREIVQLLQEPGMRERLFRVGMEAAATRADELAATVQTEIVKYGNLIRTAGIRVD
jgi:tripartite-type tricarboxylate transporter receptor subunit TctC